MIAVGLLILGGVAGVILLTKPATATSDFAGRPTLWGLFLLGVGGGLMLIFALSQVR